MAGGKNNRNLAKSNRPSNQPAKNNPTHVSIQATHTHSETTIYDGILPPPELLREFNDIVPNGADRYMTQFEIQSAHRQSLEKKVIYGGVIRERWGQIFAFLIGISGIGTGGYLVVNGHDVAGGAFVGGTLLSLVTVFLKGSSNQKEERIAKAKEED